MDGWVTIGTRLDTKQLEKDLRQAQNELKKYENEAEKLSTQKARAKVDLQPYQEEIKALQQMIQEDEKLASTTAERTMNERFYKQELDNINSKYAKQISNYETINSKIKSNASAQQIVKNKIQETNQELAKSRGFDGLKTSISDINNSMSNVIHKVVKWGLAIFSVRSAYMFVRNAISELSQSNAQLSADIEYIRFALASTLEPIILRLIQLVYKLMAYMNYLTQAWFGVNIFARASADAFKKAKDSTGGVAKNVGSAAKSAKELRKQLAGFDEMNILNDNVQGAGGSGGGAGGGGFTAPSWDLSSLKDVKIPKWLKWIRDNGKVVASIIGAIGAALLALKIAPFLKAITGATTSLAQFKAGVALVAAGLVLLITNIINLIFHWDEMSTKQKILSIALAALGAAFIAFGYAIAAGFSTATLGVGAIIAAVVALATTIVSLIIKLSKEKEAIKSVKDAQEALTKAKDNARKAENSYIDAIDEANDTLKELKDAQNKTGISGEDLYKKVQNGTLDYKNMNAAQKEVYRAYMENLNAQDKVKKATEENSKAKHNVTMKIWEEKLAVDAETGSYKKYRDQVVKAYNDGKLSAKDAQILISKAMTNMSKDSQKTFTKDLPSDIKKGIDPSRYQTTWQRFKSDWKKNLAKLSGKVTLNVMLLGIPAAIEAINKLKKKLNLGGGKKSAKGAIVTLPKLASGGVVSRPGPGVPLGNAIIGEAGAEGVIPLTDSQQMMLLGEAIGRYITVNANITNTMNGRVISREIQKVQNQTDFATNR